MKKALIALIVLALAGAGIYWFFFYSDRGYPEKLFPENTIAYLVFSGIDSIETEGKQTLLWKKIESSPRKSLYSHQFDRFMSLSESVVGVDLRPLLGQFTREIALGVIPVTEAMQAGSLVAYVKKEDQAREFLEMKLDPTLKRRFPDLKKSPATYRDVTYYKYSSNHFSGTVAPCYALLDHHLLLTSSEVGMKILLDTKEKKLASLKKNDVFRDSRKEVQYKSGIFLFVNASSALQFAKNRLPSRAQFLWPAILQISGLQAVRGLGYTLGFQGEGFREEAFVTVDKNRQGIAKAYMQQQPQKLSGLAFVPVGSQVAGAGTLPDGRILWKEIESQIQSTLSGDQLSQYRSLLQMLAGLLNFDLKRDLFDPSGRQFRFGNELAFSATDIKIVHYFIALELRDPNHFRSVLDRLYSAGEQRGLARHQENYQGLTIDLLDLHSGSMNISPAFAFQGSWLYFGTTTDFMKQAVDSMKNKKNITSLSDFQKVTSGFPDELNSISYTNLQATLQRYALAMETQSRDPESSWIRESGLTDEMKELSKSLFGSASYMIVEKRGVRYRSYSSIPNGLLFLPAILTSSK